ATRVTQMSGVINATLQGAASGAIRSEGYPCGGCAGNARVDIAETSDRLPQSFRQKVADPQVEHSDGDLSVTRTTMPIGRFRNVTVETFPV
ncbi:MAG: hypothetical protein Q4P23_12545, partial [Micrococcaceae bacterium]|nr:hypothetical protein [Micrococcaceae bacterium]